MPPWACGKCQWANSPKNKQCSRCKAWRPDPKRDEEEKVRLQCAYWIIRANGFLRDARKDAAKSASGFARSNGPWITAMGYVLPTMQKAVEDGFVLVHAKCGYGTVQGDERMGRGCTKCLITNLQPDELKQVSLKKDGA